MQEPHEIHWKDAKRILKYVHDTINYGIHYVVGCSLDLMGFKYFNWDGNNIDRKNTSGYAHSLGSGPICWSSKKQSTIYLSSPKFDYKGVINIIIQELYLQNFLTDLDIQFHCSTIIWCDIRSTFKFCKDLVQWQQTKHIEIHMHYIK